MLLLLHQIVKAFPLFRGQFLADLLLNIVVFVVDVRRDLVPEVANAFLGVADDFFDARVLFGCQVELFLHAPHQFHFAKLLERERGL